jgi:hypothetical protein
VQLKLGTIHRKDSLHNRKRGGIEQKIEVALRSQKSKKKRKTRSEVPQDKSQVSVGGLLALGYGSK